MLKSLSSRDFSPEGIFSWPSKANPYLLFLQVMQPLGYVGTLLAIRINESMAEWTASCKGLLCVSFGMYVK
jgi:hypothetical protein